tara:strand:- start:190 stop:783 length:594 start_codon:yes stop_codon:yes gene_type:complete
MVYFLGRDCEVYITTEGADGTDEPVSITTGTSSAATAGTGGEIQFASERTGSAVQVTDLTGVDLSIGAIDEDISYFGFRSVTKAEIKKETTLSLTRKKTDEAWEVIYSDARYGVSGTSGDAFTAYALTEPTIGTGYRIHVKLKDSTEVFTIMGACVQAHSVSVNADGVDEETLEFMSYITPNIGTANYTTVLDATDL